MAKVEDIIDDGRLLALYRYWDRRRGERAMPSRADLEPTGIPHLLPHLMLTDVMEDGRRFRFRLVGTAVADATGLEPTGKFLEEVLPAGPHRDHIFGLFRAVVERGRPIYSECDYLGPNGAVERSSRRLMLPLAKDGQIGMLLSGHIFITHTPQFHPLLPGYGFHAGKVEVVE